MTEPTYEDLKSGRGRAGLWKEQLITMQPGEVKELQIPEGTDFATAASAAGNAGVRLGLPIKMRRRDGVLYAVYLKPEDANGTK